MPRPGRRRVASSPSQSRIRAGILALALNLAAAAPAAALLCSTADPAVVPGGTILNTIPSHTINAILGKLTTPPFLEGSTSYVLTNSGPFITARTFVYNPSNPQGSAIGSYTMPLAQLRGLMREQYLDYWALPNFPNSVRNNAIALVIFPPGTQFWSGPTGPITDPATQLFWGNGGGLQYYAGPAVTGHYQIPPSYYVFPTPDNGGPVLVYGPRLSGNAHIIGAYLDQRCVAAYSDLDRVLTSLDVLNLANPSDPGPLAAAVSQLSPDRYGALPLIIGRQHTLILDAFGGRVDASRWAYGDVPVDQRAIARGVMIWGRALGDLGDRSDSDTMPGYRTNTGGGLSGATYEDGKGLVLGVGGGYLKTDADWSDSGGSSGDIETGVLGAYGGVAPGRMVLDGALAGTYSLIDVNRRIAIPDAGLGIPGLSTAISRTANGTVQAPGLAARLDLGMDLNAGRTTVKPFGGLSYGWLYQPSFTETNAGSINLTVDDKVSDVLRSRLGAVASYELGATGPIALALQGSLVWSHRLSASSGDITAGLIGQPGSFTIETVLDDRDSLQAGLAVIGKTGGGHMFIRYDGDFRPEFQAHAIAAGMALQF